MRNLAFFIAALCLTLMPACAPAAESLDGIQAEIVSDFKTVNQLSAKEVLALDPGKTLILDIREPEEFAVSRLPGAIRINQTPKAPSPKLAM